MSEAMRILARVLRDAEAFDGIFSTDRASQHGLHTWAISRLVDDSVLERVAPGHLRAAHLGWDLRARQRQALIHAGADSALAARSALHHWGFGPRPERIEVLIPRGQRQQRPIARVIQRLRLRRLWERDLSHEPNDWSGTAPSSPAKKSK